MGTSAVKAVELSLEGGDPVLTGFGRVEVRPGESQEAALHELLASGAFKSRCVSLGVAGQSTVVRYLEMVRMSDAELRQAIPFELQSHLPFEVEEVTYDCQALEGENPAGQDAEVRGDGQDTMTVLLAACRKDLIEAARANGWWTILDPVEDLLEPDDLAAALDAVPAARVTRRIWPHGLRVTAA